jgi:PAS domain S-box-containing protein
MYSIFGINREDFTGKLQDVITRSIHPDDLAEVEASNLSVIEKKKPIPLEYRIILPDGSIRTVWAEAGELKLDEKGNPAVLSGIVQDITKRKEAEAEQKRLEAQLLQSQKLESLGQLAGGIAHDFNNQLSGIMGYAELINPGLDQSTLMRYAGNIKQGAKNAAKLTQQLLSFARKGQYSREVINIHEILDEVVGILSHTIDKRIQIVQNRQMKNPTTLGDSSQIQNTLLNIALNARDAIEGSGTITFTTDFLHLEQDDKKYPGSLIPGEYIEIKVTDDGCGIDEETMKHIFEPFFTTKEMGQGTGMGLSAAYGAVIHHGGDLFAESEPLKGTTFHIILPYRQAGPGVEKPGASLETLIESEKPVKILIVDDDQAFRELLTVVLKDLGYMVHAAANGKEGLDYFTQNSEDLSLVILDMIMPKMGGEELYESLRKINPKIKILISSGYTPEDKSISRIVGAGTPFIQKPCSISELAQAVADALGRDPSSGMG